MDEKFILNRFYISGSPIDTSGSTVNITVTGSLSLNKEELIKTINSALEKRGIKRGITK